MTPALRFLPILTAMALALPVAVPAAAAPERPDRVLVRFADGTDESTAMGQMGAVRALGTGSRTGITVAEVAPGDSAAAVARRLRARPDVLWAEPDRQWHTSVLGDLIDDPGAEALWGLDNVGQSVLDLAGIPDVDVDAPEAWKVTQGTEDVVVAVVDTGIDISHPDLAANIWTNPGEIPGNGVDDDGNGLVDDVHGWDFHHDDASVYDPADGDKHGTHVAGTIGAVANNGRGIAGVAPGVTIMPVKFIGADGQGWNSDAIAALEYAAAMGADVINASWGGVGDDPALSDAIASLDLVFVAAAGNQYLDLETTPSYPAAYPHDTIVSVAAVDSTGALPAWSNRGATTVDLGAPGVDVASTLPGNSYGYFNGTSMAAPHVAGVAALVRSLAPGLSPAEAAEVVRSSASPLSSLDGQTVTGGIVRAGAAVQAVVDAPGAVRRLTASPGNGQATMSWQAPAEDGGYPVTDYVVRAMPGSHRKVVTTLGATLTGLDNGTTHTVTVVARTAGGSGPSTSVEVTPVAPARATTEEDTTHDTTTSEPAPEATVTSQRLAGGDRYATAAAISAQAFPGTASDVYVATGQGFPDALSGTAAAAARGGPVLLVGSGHVPDPIAAELDRLRPERIWVLGGPSAVSQDVLAELGATGARVQRLAGGDRYTTSATVSAHAFAPGAPVAYVATGTGFPDALGAGAAAGRLGGPVLLTAQGALPNAIADELARLRPARVVVLGGTAAIDEAVVAAAAAASGAPVERIGGSSRYETSARVVTDAFAPGVPAVYIATGEGFPDALAGGAAAATSGSPVLLVPPTGPLPAATVDELRRLRPGAVVALGGTTALPDAVVEAVHAVIG